MIGRSRRMSWGALLALTLGACAKPAPPDMTERGRHALASYGCGSCHMIPGVAWARGRIGPELSGVGQRNYVAGRLTNEPATLARFIRYPQELDPGTIMPDLAVSEADARDMAAYLYSLR